MKNHGGFFIGVAIFIIMISVENQAIPAFSREYGFNCMMCHTGYAKLNDLGQRFRDNGYQMPGQEGKDKNVFELSPPIAMRLSFGETTYNTDKGTSSGFNLYGLDLLAAGVLHKNISFLLIYRPRIDNPSAIFSGPDSVAGNALQPGALESFSLVFSNIIHDALNVRVGSFEPGYHAFSSKRSYYLFQPYKIYTLTTPNNSFVFDDNQIGIEAAGHFHSGFKYSTGVINGSGANPENNNYKDVYINVSQAIGKGDGQSAGQRIGLFGYYGMQPVKLPGTVISPTGNTNGAENKPFYRIGGTGSLNWKNMNLQMMYLRGVDDAAFNVLEPTKEYEYSGGFFELDYAGLLNNRLVTSVMYNWTRPPSYDPGRKSNDYSALGRYYLGDWSALNIALHGEYTYRVTNASPELKDNMFVLGLDLAF